MIRKLAKPTSVIGDIIRTGKNNPALIIGLVLRWNLFLITIETLYFTKILEMTQKFIRMNTTELFISF